MKSFLHLGRIKNFGHQDTEGKMKSLRINLRYLYARKRYHIVDVDCGKVSDCLIKFVLSINNLP